MIFSTSFVVLGAVITVLGRHSVLGLCLGAGMMMGGWVALELVERRGPTKF